MRASLGFLFLAVALVQGPSQEGVVYLPAAKLKGYAAALKGKMTGGAAGKKQSSASEQLAGRGNHSFMVIRRDESGEAEVHAGWHDVHIPQDGEATMIYGGKVEGARETGPGELRGGRIVGGTAQKLVPGDVILIPAGVPHHTTVAPGRSVTVMIIKIEKKQ
jgi:uncharacterized RmlC-like cupin family protein